MNVLRAGVLMLLAVAAIPAAVRAAPCDGPRDSWGPFMPLAHTEQRLRSHQPITVVAIGSSSTFGTGATSPGYSYPSQLADILRQRFPGARIDLVNAGIGGETVTSNLARFQHDVIAHRPDLVIWQVGMNDAFQRRDGAEVRTGILSGVAKVRAMGADIVLMDAQYLPTREDTVAMRSTRTLVRQTALEAHVQFLPRYVLMHHWIETGQFSPATMLVGDGIHMTDASYRCLAERVADLLPLSSAEQITLATNATGGSAQVKTSSQ